MKTKPAVATPASGPTVTAAEARATFRRARRAAGYTQEGLSRAAGLSETYVKKLELGRLPHPTQATRVKLARVLDWPPDELFEGFDLPPRVRRRDERHETVRQLYQNEEKTIPEIALELGHRTWGTVGGDVKALGISRPMGTPPKYADAGRLCLRCGKPLRFRYPSDYANRRGRYHRECFEAGSVVNVCPVCGKERRRCAAHAHKKCCGYLCSNRYRWHVSRMGLEPFIKSGRWSGPARRDWLRRLRAREVGKLGGPKPKYTDKQARLVHQLNKAEVGGRVAIARVVSRATGKRLTPDQVPGILRKPPP